MRYRDAALAWLAEDPDPDTRDELQRLLDLGDEPGIADRFGDRLEFGTAGIRGQLGAGPNRMNRALVRRVTAGLAQRLTEAVGPAASRGVVVGHDARHKSAEFAEDTARVLAGAGLAVWRFPDVVPTPLVAYAVKHLGAAAGVQVTASHNPPADNGYKVYGPGGRQIVSPLDAEISAAIDEVGPLSSIPLAALDDPLLWTVEPDVEDSYVAEVLALVDEGGPRDLRVVYTPLHGVAGRLCTRVLREAGFDDVHVVPEQADPDPDFPTVEFPNPEEPGTMDLALAAAASRDADLVLANDPDGDRIAAAIPTATGWRMLTGDEIGCLLAEDLLSRRGGGPDTVVATTVVSSSLLAEIAEAHGAGYAETLTGFKWLATVGVDAEARGARLVLAYEQALGVSLGGVVPDKDGISAALALADLAARLKATGRGLGDALDDLARRHGAHVTVGRSLQLDEAAGDDVVQAALDRIRAHPPTTLAGEAVVAIADHDAGVVTHVDGSIGQIDLPPQPLLRLFGAEGTRVMVRPSGTEPKLKFYGEAVRPVDGDPEAARAAARAHAEAALDAFVAAAVGQP